MMALWEPPASDPESPTYDEDEGTPVVPEYEAVSVFEGDADEPATWRCTFPPEYGEP